MAIPIPARTHGISDFLRVNSPPRTADSLKTGDDWSALPAFANILEFDTQSFEIRFFTFHNFVPVDKALFLENPGYLFLDDRMRHRHNREV
jgi:hypothetical protein